MTPLPLAGGFAVGQRPAGDDDPVLWKTRAPLLAILLLLALIVVLPIIVHQRITSLQKAMLGTVLPVQRNAEILTTALVGELLTMRAYLFSGDSTFLLRHDTFVEEADRTLTMLMDSIEGVGPETKARLAEVDLAMRRWRAHVEMVGLSEPAPDLAAFRERIREDQDLFEDLLFATLGLYEANRRDAHRSFATLLTFQRIDIWATIGLALLTVAAVALMALAGRRARWLAIEMRVNAQVEREFLVLARELTATDDPDRLLATAADGARILSLSVGVYVERWLRRDHQSAIVIAAAGQGTPPRGAQFPVPGSLEGFGGEEPRLLARATELPDTVAELLPPEAERLAALVLPLHASGETLGALVLFREAGPDPFPVEDVRRIRILADFTSLALRRALLVQETELRRREVEESEQRFRSIFDYNLEGIIEMDLDGRVVRINPGFAKMTGYSAEELLGRDWREVILPDHHRTASDVFDAAAAGAPRDFECEVEHKDGPTVVLSGTILPVVVHGQIVGAFAIVQDITERKRSERERARLLARERAAHAEAEFRREQVEQLMESRSRLIRGFGHDLKNPLGAISGHADLLVAGIKGELAAEQKESISRIRQAARSMLHLIEDLVDLSLAQAGELRLAPEDVDIAELVRETAEEHRAEAENAGLELVVHPPGELPRIHTDPRRVRQILSNLLSNAVKYTDEGDRIDLHVERREGGSAPGRGRWIAIDVRDNGPGVPHDQKERIFEEFARLEDGSERGSGLGLAISRRIARVLGGDVTVESEPDQGATFTLWVREAPLRGA